MSFASARKQPYATGTPVAFTSPLAAFSGSKISLNTVTSGSTTSTAGLVLDPGLQSIEFESLGALVETNITTSSLTVVTKWQVNFDGTNWLDLVGKNCAANVQKPATGTGSLVTTQYVQAYDGINPATKQIRLAVLSAGATGGSGDSVTVAYFWRNRFVTSVG